MGAAGELCPQFWMRSGSLGTCQPDVVAIREGRFNTNFTKSFLPGYQQTVQYLEYSVAALRLIDAPFAGEFSKS